MAIGQPEPPQLIDLVNWHDLYSGTDIDDDAIIDGLAFRGRWTAIASPAKAGKSTVILALAVAATQAGHVTAYVDTEMGRGDVLARVKDWMHLGPDDLADLHYCDLPPKLDTVQGAVLLHNTVAAYNPALVVIDGLNGVVNGAENDDTTWRDMYEWGIAPLKRAGVAVISADNLGKARDAGPRGSSVKMDKADAILRLERTDIGVKLTATHRRTSAYPAELEYRVTDASEEGAPMRVTRVDAGAGYPPGVKEIAALLDLLGAPLDIGRGKAQDMLRAHDGSGRKNDAVGCALRYRREHADPFSTGTKLSTGSPENGLSPLSPGQAGTAGTRHLSPVPDPRGQVRETPAYRPVPAGVSLLGHPPGGPEKSSGTGVPSEREYEEPF